MKILAIDDSALILGMLEMVCGSIGIELDQAEEIPQEISGVDAVVVDLNLPGVDDTVVTVKSRFNGPLYVLSGESQEKLDAMNLDVDGCWSKDLGMGGIAEKLEELKEDLAR